jgi:hypothetical protein
MRTPPDVCAGELGNQHREIRVKKLISAAPGLAMLCAVVALTVGIGSGVSSVTGVCAEGDSGKVDVYGDDATLTLTAPDGYVITSYCVKAGSEKQGDGSETYTVDPPAQEVVISHSSGKAISHYSYTLAEGETAECPPEDLFCVSVAGGE